MIDPEELRPLRTGTEDQKKTDELKELLRDLKQKRSPYYLTESELDPIFRWKLRGQYARCKRHFAKNTPSGYKVITQLAFSIHEPDPDYETMLRLGVLMSLPGIDIGIASAILALTEPDKYCVVDFRGWRVFFDEERKSFTIQHYLRYLREVRRLAQILGWDPQEVDAAAWEYDRRRRRKPRK